MYWGALFPNISAPNSRERIGEPIPLPGQLPFASVTVGFDFACGLVANRSAYCIGESAIGSRRGQSTLCRCQRCIACGA